MNGVAAIDALPAKSAAHNFATATRDVRDQFDPHHRLADKTLSPPAPKGRHEAGLGAVSRADDRDSHQN